MSPRPNFAPTLTDERPDPPEHFRRGMPLTRREEEALVALVNGGPGPAGLALFGTSNTRWHRVLQSAREKLGAETTTHAVVLAYRRLSSRLHLPCDGANEVHP